MSKKNGHGKQLTCRIHTRLTQEKYDELSEMLKHTRSIKSLSELLRHILNHKTITVKTYDATADNVMSEIAKFNDELNAIGININQLVRIIHSLDLPEDRLAETKEMLQVLLQTQQKISEASGAIAKLSEQWSPE